MDVEFAHQEAEPADAWLARAEVAGSAAVARAFVGRLREHEDVAVVTSALIDDKKNRSVLLDERRRACVAGCLHGLGVDRVMLESDLIHHARPFCASLPLDSAVRGRFSRRLAHHGELACSQDIAIWHSLRLGLFSPVDPALGWHGTLPIPTASADCSVAILPQRFQAYEEKAYRQHFPALRGSLVRGDRRTVLHGWHRGREVTLWAIWVDTGRSLGELRELGRSEAAHVARSVMPRR